MMRHRYREILTALSSVAISGLVVLEYVTFSGTNTNNNPSTILLKNSSLWLPSDANDRHTSRNGSKQNYKDLRAEIQNINDSASSATSLISFASEPEPSTECSIRLLGETPPNTIGTSTNISVINAAEYCALPRKRRMCNGHVHSQENMPTGGVTVKKKCKTLWFAGMSEGKNSECGKPGGYKKEYAAALSSANLHAKEVLQPILLLGRYGLENENSTDPSALGRWAERNGAIVKVIPRLSFQNIVTQGLGSVRDMDHQMGPFLRLDIPKIIEQYNLFELPNICQRHVLYTDSDVIFPNKITHEDMEMLKWLISPNNNESSSAFVLYGRESGMRPAIENTGVMMMDVERFAEEWPSILDYGRQRLKEGRRKKFPAHDQEWLNLYFKQNENTMKMRNLLPIYWNWKVYWTLQPSFWRDLKVIHFHGPKPGRGLEEIAQCKVGENEWTNVNFPLIAYKNHIESGICCDKGRTATRSLKMYQLLQPPEFDICG